jgi:hypothetical protein
MTLDDVGILHGTDKSSLRQGFLAHYDRLLGNLRDASFNLIEIGIHHGASLKTWEVYFPNATIIGVDVEPSCRRHVRGRVQVEIGSQDDPEFLAMVAAKYPPRVIIDDGSHRADHQIFSFEQLFPALAPGGCYIVEDITAAPAPQYRTSSRISSAEYFGAIAAALISGWTIDVTMRQLPTFVPNMVSWIAALGGAIAIFKAENIDPLRDLARVETLARQSDEPESLLYLSEHLANRVGALESALQTAREGAQKTPSNPWFQVQISRLLVRIGDLEGAIAAAQKSVELGPPGHPFFKELLEKLANRGGS